MLFYPKINELIQFPDHVVCVCLWHWVRQEHILLSYFENPPHGKQSISTWIDGLGHLQTDVRAAPKPSTPSTDSLQFKHLLIYLLLFPGQLVRPSHYQGSSIRGGFQQTATTLTARQRLADTLTSIALIWNESLERDFLTGRDVLKL